MDTEPYRLDGLTASEHILGLAPVGKADFTRSLHPGIDNVLGVRVPHLRTLAARIAKDNPVLYLATAGTHYMEERMLYGMVLGQIKTDDTDEYLRLVDTFVDRINSWSVCDTFDFAGRRRFVRSNKERVWQYLTAKLMSDKEYTVRFGVVMLMTHYIDADHIDRLLESLAAVRHEAYYARMAVAWALSVCYVKFPEKTLPLLEARTLAPEVQNLAIRKIRESNRVPAQDKALVLTLKA